VFVKLSAACTRIIAQQRRNYKLILSFAKSTYTRSIAVHNRDRPSTTTTADLPAEW
jgi:hypothetical protein